MSDWESIDVLGVRIDRVDFTQTLDQIEQWIKGPPHPPISQSPNLSCSRASHFSLRQICTVNPEFIIDAQRDPAFANVLRRADLCVPDGIGVLWAARRQGVTLCERVTGSDGIYRVAERGAQEGWRIFLLGAAEGVAAEAGRVLGRKFPRVPIVGTHSGTPRDADWPAVEAALSQSRPDFLFVAFGHPQQDLWITRHRDDLARLGVRVAMGVGGAFDFVAGVQTRAPRWMQRLGLEWLYRLVRQPWRWRRMVKLPIFIWRILHEQNGQSQGKGSTP